MNPTLQKQLLEFLQTDLAIPAEAIAVATRHKALMIYQLPIILWQYGLVTLPQLDAIFNWLEKRSSQSTTDPRFITPNRGG